MKTIKFLFFFTAIFSLIMISGCEKDGPSDPSGNDDNTKEFKVETITVPDAMAESSDPGAQMATTYVDMANGMASMSSMLIPPKSAVAYKYKGGGDPEIYNWNINDGEDNNYNVTLTIYETNEMYKWEMKVDGLIDGHQVDNVLFMKAEQYKEGHEDGHDNSFLVYDLEKPLTVIFLIKWHVTNDVFYLTFEETEIVKVDFVINKDNSGSIDAKNWTEEHEYQTTYAASWDSSGHGEYWEYENGEVVYHGTW